MAIPKICPLMAYGRVFALEFQIAQTLIFYFQVFITLKQLFYYFHLISKRSKHQFNLNDLLIIISSLAVAPSHTKRNPQKIHLPADRSHFHLPRPLNFITCNEKSLCILF